MGTKNIIERAIIPHNLPKPSVVTQGQYALYAPIVSPGQVGMAKFDEKHFAIENQTVSLNDAITDRLSVVTDGLSYELSSNGTYYKVSGIGSATDTDIVIPRFYKGLPVERIHYDAFKDNVNITSVDIPDTVTMIENSAFENCISLVRVKIPDSVEEIGGKVFWGCTKLKEVNLPNGLKYIGQLFGDCESLEFINIPDSVTLINTYAFAGCVKLNNINLSKNLIEIRREAFTHCKSLSIVHIPKSVTTIERSVFYECSNLTIYCEAEAKPDGWDEDWNLGFNNTRRPVVWGVPLDIPTLNSKVDELSARLTSAKENLQGVEENLKRLEDNTYTQGLSYVLGSDNAYYVSGMGTATDTDIIIPRFHKGLPIRGIAVGAFQDNTTITGVIIPDNIIRINIRAFEGCINLTRAVIGRGVTTINSAVFRGCTSLKTVNIPDTVTSIEAEAFEDCTSLTHITIPENVSEIKASAFYNCVNLIKLNYNATAVNYSIHSLGAFGGDTGTKSGGFSVVVGKNVTKIPESQFTGTKITHLEFEEGSICKSIDDFAFKDCTSLEKISLPESLTSIGIYAFRNCTSLKKISIPKNVASIGTLAFGDCTGVEEIYFDASSLDDCPVNSTNFSFNGVGINGKGTILNIGKNVTKIPSYLFNTYSKHLHKITEVRFEKDCICERILSQAFTDSTNLVRVVIPNTVTSIRAQAFFRCTNLTIYCEAEAKPDGWHEDWNYVNWNYANCPVVWGVPLDFIGVNDKLKEYADGIKDDLLNGAGPAYDTLKELGDAIDENRDVLTAIQEIANNKLDKSNAASRLYCTLSSGKQSMVVWGKQVTPNAIPQRTDTGNLRIPLEPENDDEATSKKYVDNLNSDITKKHEALEDRVTNLENLTLSYHEITSTDYEKAVPADVGEPARIKMTGGATEKVYPKNILNPRNISFHTDDDGGSVTAEYNDDGTITYTLWGYSGRCWFNLWNLPVGRYYLYLENASPELIDTDFGNISLWLESDYREDEGTDFVETTRTLKVMLWRDESVTTEDYEIVEAPEGTVFEPYHEPYLQDAEVERIESIGADGETVLDTSVIPEAVKLKAVNDTYYDYIVFVDNRVYGYKVVEEIVLNGTEEWASTNIPPSSTQANYFYVALGTPLIGNACICDAYEQAKLSVGNALIGINVAHSNYAKDYAVMVRPLNYATMTVNDLKAQLTKKPITLIYARATPEVTDITDLFTEGNKLQVQQGGAIRFVNERKMAIPNTVAFIKRKE